MKFYIKTITEISNRPASFMNRIRQEQVTKLVAISVATEAGYTYTAISKDYIKGNPSNLEQKIGVLAKNLNIYAKYNYQIAKGLNEFVAYHAFNNSIEWHGWDQNLDLTSLLGLSAYGPYAVLHPAYCTDLRQSVIEYCLSLSPKSFLLLPSFQAVPDQTERLTPNQAICIMESHQGWPDPEEEIEAKALWIARVQRFLEELKNEVLLIDVKTK